MIKYILFIILILGIGILVGAEIHNEVKQAEDEIIYEICCTNNTPSTPTNLSILEKFQYSIGQRIEIKPNCSNVDCNCSNGVCDINEH